MNAFLYGVVLQWKIDTRNKAVLMTYYTVPLVFFAFMGAVFSSINPEAKDTLIQSMTIFGITMGAILGTPQPLVELYGSDIKKAYTVGKIPLWSIAVNNFISAFIHLFIMSLVIFFIAPIAFDAKVPENLLVYFISQVIFLITSLSVGTVLGLFITNTTKLTMFSQILFLPSLMLSGIMFPINLLPEILGYVGQILPATWAFKIMSSNIFDISLLIPLVIILIVSITFSWFRLARMEID